MKNEQRISPRTLIKLTVRITFQNGDTLDVETWDLSDSGLSIQIPAESNSVWAIGMNVKAQVQGLPVEGPELAMEVVRMTEDRIGMKLISSAN